MNEDIHLGARFWFIIIGLCVAAVVGASLFFILFGHLWEALGFFGAFLVLGGVLIAFGYAWDRRERRRRRGLAA